MAAHLEPLVSRFIRLGLAWCASMTVAFAAGKRMDRLFRNGEQYSMDGRVTFFVFLVSVLVSVILCFVMIKRRD